MGETSNYTDYRSVLMITFTQTGELLASDNGKIGNQFSDVTVRVNLSDDTFSKFDFVGLYVADPVRSQYVFPYKIEDGLCTIKHEALSGAGDVRVCVAGYNVDGGQLTTNAIPLIVRPSNNPAGSTPEVSDWKSAMAQAMAEACISNERYLAAQAEALAETAAAREAMATAGAEYARDHGIAVPTVINNLTTNSSAAALSAEQGRVLKALIDDKDKIPTSGSARAAESGGIYDALVKLAESAETGNNWAPVGNLSIAAGALSLTGLNVTTEAEGNYYGVADVGGKTSLLAEQGFPCCFTGTPTVWMFPTGSESTMWCGRSAGEAAGIRSAAIFRGKQKENSTFTGRYLVIGRNDGARRRGADVITQGLEYIGKACGSEIVSLYNAFADNQQDDDAAWCSEFASVCAHNAGISTDIFPYFASAYKGSGKFSDLGMLYVLKGSSFVKATVTNSNKNNYAYTLGTETYVPQLGDVLFLTTLDDDDTPASAPNHTALITSVGTANEQTVLYTLEGNQSNAAGDRTVQRRTRTIGGSQKRDQAIFAIGRVNYPINSGGSKSIAVGQAARSSSDDSGPSVTLDTTLSKSGYAADAAAVGAALEKKANTADIPTALKNPYSLTFTGAVTGTYDGSKTVTIKIPEAETGTGAGVTVVNADGSITAEDIYDLADGEYWFAKPFEQASYLAGMNLSTTTNTKLVGYALCKNHTMYCQTTGYSVAFVAATPTVVTHAASGVAISGWTRTSVTLSSATDSTSETTAATSKAVSDALAAAKTYADDLIGGIENGTY